MSYSIGQQNGAVAVFEAPHPFPAIEPPFPVGPTGAMRNCTACQFAGLACASCQVGLAQTPPVQTTGVTGWLDTWAQKLRDVANILTNASRVPSYTQTGYEVSTAQQSFNSWIGSPFTWVIGLALLLLVFKLRMANK